MHPSRLESKNIIVIKPQIAGEHACFQIGNLTKMLCMHSFSLFHISAAVYKITVSPNRVISHVYYKQFYVAYLRVNTKDSTNIPKHSQSLPLQYKFMKLVHYLKVKHFPNILSTSQKLLSALCPPSTNTSEYKHH